ncbi:glycoside hydrolase family 19 protein [Herbaspirillum huttiense]|uniref:glycoside hydrolase family 19 protein n=1 Tax=Herbaspirillum huttiense TaxID=863372 RepID=UPI0010649C75|nr:glycoside hydrolase family 19 protein [Herbaspirillum huttiense]QBP75416.1 glycoside hydrolase family 19 protein [Herbaspirillum huttiense]
MDLTIDQLRQIMPASMRASSFLGSLNAAMREFGIVTAQRQGMFLANVGAESGQLSTLVENLNYSADRIRQIGNASPAGSRWRSLVPRAVELAANPERMGNAVYCNRMGNGDEASGEGFLYRGRGLLQTTGKTNYIALMMALGIDCAVHPELLEQPEGAARAAAYYWHANDLSEYADAGDFDGVCDIINIGRKTAAVGDSMEYAKRLALYKNAKQVLS